MNTTPIVETFRSFFYSGFEITFPIMLSGLVLLLIIAILMAAMQIQEQTLTFVPKLLFFGIVLYIWGPLIFDKLMTLIRETWDKIPGML